MVEIELPRAGDALEHLLPPDAPARPRALAVLEGLLAGRAWVDDPAAPAWTVLVETGDGTVYAGGSLDARAVRDSLAGVETSAGDLVFGFSGSHDPLRELMPGDPRWTGAAIDFTDRVAAHDEVDAITAPLADGARIVSIDASTLPLTEWYEDTLHAFGGLDRWAELGIGYGVLLDGRLVSEALAGPRCRGVLEMGVATRDGYRGRGYATVAARCVARACEARGDRVWWNANADNAPSLAIARRLGFSVEHRYELCAVRAPIG